MAQEGTETRLQLLKQALLDPIIDKLVALDPKIVAAGVTYIATYIVTDLLNLGLEDKLLGAGPLNVTWTTAIAFAAAGIAGYFKTNIATILRKPQPDGNPSAELVEKHLGKENVGA